MRAKKLKAGDIIEVVQNIDGLHIRRVKVKDLKVIGDYNVITGVNLQGKNPIGYTLPKKPVKRPEDVLQNATGFIVCEPAIAIDE